eukprot:406504-Amphidinium_carterae.1
MVGAGHSLSWLMYVKRDDQQPLFHYMEDFWVELPVFGEKRGRAASARRPSSAGHREETLSETFARPEIQNTGGNNTD